MRKLALCFLLCTVLALSACSSGTKVIVVSVTSPSGAQALDLGQSFNITVSVSNDALNKGATFTLSGVGALSNQTATGATYTAPATGTGGSATITITSASDTTKSTTLSIVVSAPPTISTTTLPAAAMGTTYSGTVAVTGGAGTLNYSVTVGALPAGLTLGATSGAITGTATGPTGVVNFTVQVKDSSTVSPQSTTKALSITVNQPAAITSTNNAAFTAGVAGSFTVTTTGTSPITITETGTLPTGVTFKDNGDGTGTLGGTAATAGAYPITFTASNGFGSNATQNFTLNIQQAPAITSANAATFTVGTAGTFPVTTSGFPAPSLTETGALPTGVTFKDNGNGTATLAGTPAAATGSNYTYSFSVKATNSLSTATQTFTLTVDQGPAITSLSSTTFTQGAASTFPVTTSGFPTPSLSETGALPAGVTFVDNGNGTATLAGTPSGTSGTYSLSIKATNSVSSTTQTFTLTIGQAPAFTSAIATTFTVGTAGTFSVTVSGFPAPTLTESGTLPTGVTFTPATGILAGTPAANMGGTYTLTFTAHNGTVPDATQTFTLTVHQAPAITSSANATFTVNSLGTFKVTTTGNPSAALTESGSLPSGVTFVDNGDGTATLSGTVLSGGVNGIGGVFPFTITANNGIGTAATQSFTLTVDKSAAITSAAATTFTVGTVGSFSVTATGFPTPSLSETGNLPNGLNFVDNGNGTATLAGTPVAGTGKVYSLTIKATNSVNTATQTFTLTVDEAPAITSNASATFSVGGAGSFSVTSTGWPLPALTETGALPNGVTFVDNGNGTATLAGTPASGTAGSYPITVKATNVVSAATQSFTLTVDNGPVITSVNTYTFIQGTAGSFTVTTTGTPTPAITETGVLPGGVTFTDNGNGTATLAGTVPSGNLGQYALTIKATNSISTATQSFALLVESVPAITSGSSTTFDVGTTGSFTVTATGFPNVTFTETGALPSGVTLVGNGPDTALLSGTPAAGTNGTYPITITANNGVGTAATQSFTLTVVIPPLAISPSSGALPPATENSSYTQNLTASGGVPPYAYALTSSSNPLPAGLSLSSTTGQISGTPTSSGTFTFSVQVTDSASPTPNTTIANLSLTVNSPGSQVSGQISLNNQCGGSGSQPQFTVSINTTPVQTTTTDTSGNYSFATVPNGTYTITPSITGPSSVFYPATQSVTVNNNSPNPVFFSSTLGYTVSGSVSYSGATTGRIYLNLSGNNCGGSGTAGTSIAAAGSFTIHGVPPGAYTLQAWIDPTTLAQGAQNTADPAGTTAVTVTDADVTGASVTLADPTVPAPTTAPNIKSVNPISQGVVISFGGGSVSNNNGVEEFTSYVVQWSTTTSGFSSSNSANFKAVGTGNNVWILTNGLAGIGGSLSSNTAYYFRFEGKNSGGAGPWSYWAGAGNSCGTTSCAVTVTTTAPSGNSISGTVTIPSTITPTGPLYVGFYNQTSNTLYGERIASPSNTVANSYNVSVPSGSNYFFFGILDQNNDGLIDVGDVSNTNGHGSTGITITGTMTGEDETLPTANSTAIVRTQFNQSTASNGSGGSQTATNYGIGFSVDEGNLLPVTVQLTAASNPNVITPLDLSNLCQGCGSVEFDYYPSIGSDVPKVNDTYTFAVTYSNGTSANVIGTVTTVMGASQVVTNMAPQATNSTNTTPTFTWTYPSNPTAYTYQFSICCDTNGTIWQIPSNNSKSNGFTNTQIPGTLTWGVDPTDSTNLPTDTSLTPGTTYNWQIQTQDANGDSASTTMWYQP